MEKFITTSYPVITAGSDLTDEQKDEYMINFVGAIYKVQYNLWLERFGKKKIKKHQLSFDFFKAGFFAGIQSVLYAEDDELTTHKAILSQLEKNSH